MVTINPWSIPINLKEKAGKPAITKSVFGSTALSVLYA